MAVSFLLFSAAACGNTNQAGTGDKELPAGDAESGTCAAGTNKTSTDTVSVPDGNDMTNDEGSSGSDPDAGGQQNGHDWQEPEKNGEMPDYELLQSASIDLDNDGINEQVKIVRTILTTDAGGIDPEDRVEGRLLIGGRDTEKQVIFCTKENDPSELLNRIEFEDLDGDGAKDIFIVIPGYGASFNYSNYFIYSYKKDRSHSFISDNTLADFIDSFVFSNSKGGNLLTVTNQAHGFTADIVIEDAEEQETSEEIMQYYVNETWIEPVSVDISEDSRLALVKNEGVPEIKVPLPVFGMATVNMIAEIDLFYRIDSDFRPVLKRCEIIDFAGNEKKKAGSFEVTTD